GAAAAPDEPRPKLTINAPPFILPGRAVELEFIAVNNGGTARQGSITVSFPGNPDVELISHSALPNDTPSHFSLFQPGQNMFNAQQGKAVAISNRSAELFAEPWPAGVEHRLRLRVVPAGALQLQARSTLRGTGLVTDPAEGALDQQGFPSYQVVALPPTATPTPTPTPTAPRTLPPAAAPPAVPPSGAVASPQGTAAQPASAVIGPYGLTASAASPGPAEPPVSTIPAPIILIAGMALGGVLFAAIARQRGRQVAAAPAPARPTPWASDGLYGVSSEKVAQGPLQAPARFRLNEHGELVGKDGD
ncbi:MAG: hypothetical protein NTZ05_00765, partial [Chloroflexi bacterium]|nr:hypothetical protein [Chloroflexota bacterium]